MRIYTEGDPPMSDLPPEVASKLLALIQEGADGAVTIPDKEAFISFVKEYGPRYPQIQELVKLDDAAVQKYHEETGRLPAGVKGTRIFNRPNSNVTEMQVIYGSSSGEDDDKTP
jgi:hypothetical protein